ncbi:hypothetical protein [Pseudomonas psychrophila]|uniref:hypothetical protein n=1 Tax=Pseudomonas psychrophila TaxID=122355 RepID=UPI000357784C|nr:hypothetical protein [Pseudomonas psychrophila]EPJ91030.1 hypothetical protein CF149_23631 [Pseudomonas psychrophila]
MANNTGNPVGSTAAKDLSDNAENLDKFANGDDYEYDDRLGRSRKSLKWIEDAALAIPALDAAVRSEEQAELAKAAKDEAESARDAAQLSAGVYPSITAGLAGTPGDKYFSVPSIESAEYLILYQNVAGSAYEVSRYPSASAVQTLDSDFRKVVRSGSAAEILASITDGFGVPTWLQARVLDGGPSEHSKTLLREAIPGLPEVGDIPGTGFSIQDELGRKTWLQTSSEDGGLTPFSVECIRRSLGLPPPPADIGYVAEGDSMTASTYGGGVPYPVTLASLLGKPVANTGVSGAWSPEVSVRGGGVTPLLTIPDGTIPAGIEPISVVWDVENAYVGNRASVTYSGKVRGIPCTLTQDTTNNVITLSRKVAGSTFSVASPVPFVVDTPHISKRHIVWSGRNDNPKTNAFISIDKLLSRIEQESIPYLLVSVCNTSNEVSGSAGYVAVANLNLQLIKRAPRNYVDMRGRMIREGLTLAGLVATPEDTAAIANDCIPPSLLADGLHFNPAGRLACALIIYDELVLRNMA